MANSVRHQILQQILSAFDAVDAPDWPLKFSVVELGPLGNEDNRKRFSVGVVPGPERYEYKFPFIVRFLTVAIEFRVTVNRDDPAPGDLAEDVLTIVERVVLQNKTWSGLALDTHLKNSEIDMTTYGDRTVMGVLWVEVHYRHSHGDPANPNPDA